MNEDYFKARAQLAFAAVESGIYEHVLATGGALNGSGQPYLGDSNLTILGGGPVSAKEGLALLSDAIGGTFRRGMIHATPATVIAWSFFGEAIQQVGGRLISAGGNDVIPKATATSAPPPTAKAPPPPTKHGWTRPAPSRCGASPTSGSTRTSSTKHWTAARTSLPTAPSATPSSHGN